MCTYNCEKKRKGKKKGKERKKERKRGAREEGEKDTRIIVKRQDDLKETTLFLLQNNM